MRSFLPALAAAWMVTSMVTSMVTLAAFVAFAPGAQAHGGGGFRGPPPPLRAPSIPCDCARPSCRSCSGPGLVEGEGLSQRETKVEVVESWGDIGRVRITAEFATERENAALEGFAWIDAGPLFAMTAGSVAAGDHVLPGVLAEVRAARRDYLWESGRRLRDPMLVQREGPGRVSVRVYPVTARARTVVTLEGYALVHPPARGGVRLYRTGNRYLAVLPISREVVPVADVLDEASGRAVLVLDAEACRRRYPNLLDAAVEVPCADLLGAAILGAGSGIVGVGRALVALEVGARAPSNLYVGRQEDAPLLDSPVNTPATLPSVPPQNDPTIPPPPPPPPPPALVVVTRPW